jgi:hypothetical protein
MKSLLVAAIALSLTGVQEKTYDLRLEWKPVTGHRSELDETSAMKMSVTVTGLGEVAARSERSAYTALESIISADAEGNGDRTWAFAQATQEKDGQKSQLGFHGRIVRVTRTKGRPRTFTLADGGDLLAEDLAALKKAFMGAEDEPGKPSGAEVFAPKSPIKVGESWSPELKTIVSGMLDREMAAGVDLEKSRSVFTLKAVERRAGADYGNIEGLMELALRQVGPLALETPILFKVTMNVDACIDGTLPDGVLTMAVEMRGKSMVSGPNGQVQMTLDMTATGKKTTKTVR